MTSHEICHNKCCIPNFSVLLVKKYLVEPACCVLHFTSLFFALFTAVRTFVIFAGTGMFFISAPQCIPVCFIGSFGLGVKRAFVIMNFPSCIVHHCYASTALLSTHLIIKFSYLTHRCLCALYWFAKNRSL